MIIQRQPVHSFAAHNPAEKENFQKNEKISRNSPFLSSPAEKRKISQVSLQGTRLFPFAVFRKYIFIIHMDVRFTQYNGGNFRNLTIIRHGRLFFTLELFID